MRTPTSPDHALQWWRRALARRLDRVDQDTPESGWFRTRAAPGSRIWLPARLWIESPVDWSTGELTGPELYRLEIAGRLITDQSRIEEKWLFLRPVSFPQWQWLQARHALHHGIETRPSLFGS